VNNSVGLLLDTFDPTVRTAPTLRSRSRPRVTEETVRNVLKSKNTSALTLLDSPHYVKLVRKAPVLAALRLHIYNLSSWTNLTKAFRHFGLSPKHDSHLLKPAIVPFCGDEWFLDFDTSDIVDWQVAMDAAFVKFGSDEKRLEHLRHMDALRRRQKTMTHVRSQRRMGLVQDISSRVGPILRDVLSRYVSDVDIRSSPQRLSMLSRALLPAERSSVAMRVYMSGKKTPYSASVLASASASISADSSSDRTSALKASCAVLSSLASACSSDLTRASCDDDLEASLSAATMIATSVSASASAITNTIFSTASDSASAASASASALVVLMSRFQRMEDRIRSRALEMNAMPLPHHSLFPPKEASKFIDQIIDYVIKNDGESKASIRLMSSRWSAFVREWSSGREKQKEEEQKTAAGEQDYDDYHPVRDVLARHVLYTGCVEAIALVRRVRGNLEEALATLNNRSRQLEADHSLYISRAIALHVITRDVISAYKDGCVLNWLRENTFSSEVYTSRLLDAAAWADLTQSIIRYRVRILYDDDDPE